METGGYKGRSRSLPKAELHALITRRLGISGEHIICEYGMSELSSQAYDSRVQAPTSKVLHKERVFRFHGRGSANLLDVSGAGAPMRTQDAVRDASKMRAAQRGLALFFLCNAIV